MIEPAPHVKLIQITGGSGAGKTRLSKRLYGELPTEWRFVPMDNFIQFALNDPTPLEWPDKTVSIAEVCLFYWRREKVYKVLIEGVIQTAAHAARLSTAFGVSWPSPEVRLLQLTRTLETHMTRRSSPEEWNPPMSPGQTREEAFLSLETRVPGKIDGARLIATDRLTEVEVYEAAVRHLS
jgi:hypothetical protein